MSLDPRDLLLPLALLPLLGSGQGREELTSTPYGIYSLTLNGEEFELVDGETTTLELGGESFEARLEAPSSRVFDKLGIYLRYPAQMAFRHDLSTPGVMMWDMDGSDSVLMVHLYEHFDRETAEEVLVPSIADSLKGLGSGFEQKRVKLDFGSEKVKGVRFTVEMQGIFLVQELYFFETDQGALAVILQDTRDRSGRATGEFKTLRDMVSTSLRVGS